ncbi:nicotinate phosphoribosyltransferase [Backusella circina FSU 941]|nr:nicotinate phosphoribosyltransferase [Backusella circina FSU 941]
MVQSEGLASVLDNDLYKFTMGYAIFKAYRHIHVTYQFTNRKRELSLNKEAVIWLKNQIQKMELLQLTQEEKEYMSKFSFFDEEYINYLDNFRYKPTEQVFLTFDENTRDLDLQIKGSWLDTILYEVPLLSLISEAYFRFVDTDWSHDGQSENAFSKAKKLLEHGCTFSEFGTRRRRDGRTQNIVVEAIVKAYEIHQREVTGSKHGEFVGTSNVYLAMKYGLKPTGTIAHEFFMGISALNGVNEANKAALEIWYKIYKGNLGIALTDTFTTDVFLRDFDEKTATLYQGLRQDSGDPFDFLIKAVDHYNAMGIDPSTKIIVFSDSLDVELAIRLDQASKTAGIQSSFGIGTFLTNDFQKMSQPSVKSKALSIVIKLRYCNGKRVVKLSDDPSKWSADSDTIAAVKRELNI